MTWPWRRRAGFTLVEVLAVLALLGVLMSVTLAALSRQVRVFGSLSAQTDAVQNGRYAMSVLEKDLPTTGMNVPEDQPVLVYADTNVVAFNADYMSNVPHDPFAVYVDSGASALFATAATKARRFTIHRTNFTYPDTTYTIAGQNSPAETIQFFVERDSSTARQDDYVLYRRVNNQDPDLLARGVLRFDPNTPFFQYFRRVTPVGTAAYFDSIPAAQLPLKHVRPIHGAVNDTGTVARIDSLRAVRVSFRVTDGQPGGQERIYSFARTIALPNAGVATKKTCGDEPLLGSVNFTAESAELDDSPAIRLSWTAATDDGGGASDIVRYVIYRTTQAGALQAGDLGDPYMSLPAGETTYSYVDTDVVRGRAYYYSLAAQDCASALSEVVSLLVIVS
jgi:prepilin-type N-terminal cleavage/methylation domain-containing protein